LRRLNQDGDEEEGEPFVDEGQMKELEESTINLHANEWWTRVVPLEGFLPSVQERFAVGPAMAAGVDGMYRIDPDELPEWAAEFDPVEFLAEHREILLGPWRLTNEQLES